MSSGSKADEARPQTGSVFDDCHSTTTTVASRSNDVSWDSCSDTLGHAFDRSYAFGNMFDARVSERVYH